MIVFDVGNTNVKCVLFEGNKQVGQVQMATVRDQRWEVYREELGQLMPDVGDVEGGAVASVVRGMSDRLQRAVADLWDVSLVEVNTSLDLGLRIQVPHPEWVGMDRLLACAEAYRLVDGAVVVAGVGSALTVDLVSGAGDYLGGTISPGSRMSFWALSERASLLPEVILAPPDGALGRKTEDCIRSGVVYGMAGAVDRLYAELNALDDGKASLVLTGGDAIFLAPYVQTTCQIESDLVAKGLFWTYRRNSGTG
ncbi:MAG: type III pantothenate kinase [bacterium]|nr:type III pantothenate kinase [bacterium]